MQHFVSELGGRLVMGAAALSLMAGVMAWSGTQSAIAAAPANSCSNPSEARCDSKVARTEDAKEAKDEKLCTAKRSEQSCRNRALAEDREEQAAECDEEGSGDGNSDCEPYGAYGESGDNHLHIAELDAATKALSSAGVDTGVVGTATSILVVVGTLVMVAVGRRRVGPPRRRV